MKFKISQFHRYIQILVYLLALLVGGIGAFQVAWIADDAYISFIYARNFSEGKGLVFQEGEKVEGFSNFFWTMLLTIPHYFGIRVEDFSILLGIGFYLLTLITLPNPWVALSYSFFSYGREFATSGLETSLFTFLITLSYKFYKKNAIDKLIFTSSLLILTRPEGLLFGFFHFLFIIIKNWKNKINFYSKELWVYLGLSIVCWIVYLTKIIYYGDIFPNTYYAKASMGAYWSQGFYYFYYFYLEYIVLTIFLLYGLVFSKDIYSWVILIYLVYVAYIGGDFMYLRFIVPILPVSFWLGFSKFRETSKVWNQRFSYYGKVFSSFIIIVYFFSPLLPTGYYSKNKLEVYKKYGISHERTLYKNLGSKNLIYNKEALRDISVAFYGAQAHFIYYMRPQYAVEASTGLTDPFLAKQPILKRGLIGHEKKAPLDYLKKRKIEIIMGDIYPELQEKGRDLYYLWEGNRLLWKVLELSPTKIESLKKYPDFDTNYLNPKLWQISQE